MFDAKELWNLLTGSSKDLALLLYAAAHLIASTPPVKVFLDNLG